MNRKEIRVATASITPSTSVHGVEAELAQILGDALVGVVDPALELDAVVAAAVEPMRQILLGQPAPPAQAQVGTRQSAGNGKSDGEAGDPREVDHLEPEARFVLVLESVEEAPAPFVVGHVDGNAGKGQHDGSDQQRDGDPALLGLEIGNDEAPPVADKRANSVHAEILSAAHSSATSGSIHLLRCPMSYSSCLQAGGRYEQRDNSARSGRTSGLGAGGNRHRGVDRRRSVRSDHAGRPPHLACRRTCRGGRQRCRARSLRASPHGARQLHLDDGQPVRRAQEVAARAGRRPADSTPRSCRGLRRLREPEVDDRTDRQKRRTDRIAGRDTANQAAPDRRPVPGSPDAHCRNSRSGRRPTSDWAARAR